MILGIGNMAPTKLKNKEQISSFINKEGGNQDIKFLCGTDMQQSCAVLIIMKIKSCLTTCLTTKNHKLWVRFDELKNSKI